MDQTTLTPIKQRVAQWKRLRASATDGTAQDGIAGCCNIVTFDGDDIRGVCSAHGGDKAFIMYVYNTDLAADCEALVAEVERLRGELEECRMYHEPRILELERLLFRAQNQASDLISVVGDIEQCRCVEGDSISILCDNPDAETLDTQAAVEVCGEYTGYETLRFYASTWPTALHKAANLARSHYRDNEELI